MTVKIGIALGGGGARGLAHVGILKVLEEEGIPIHCITGASIGAVVGAMYAQNPNINSLIEGNIENTKIPYTRDIHWSEFLRFEEVIEAGAKSAREKLPEIKKLIRKKAPWYKRPFSRFGLP